MYFKERLLDFIDQKLRARELVLPDECVAYVKDMVGADRGSLACNVRGFNFVVVVAGESMIFRFPRNRVAARELQVEAEFLKRFAPRSPLPVPQLMLQRHSPLGFSFGRYEYLPGEPLTDERYRMRSPQEQEILLRQIGSFLSSLHSFPVSEARRAGMGFHETQRWEKMDFQKVRRHLFPLLNDAQRAWATSLFHRWLSYLARTTLPRAVVHADFREEHILVNGGTLSGVIDFGDAKIGDPALDVSFLLDYGEEFTEAVLQHYIPARDSEFSLRMRYYAHRRQLVVPAYLLERGRNKEEAARMLVELPAYIKNNPR